VFLEVAHVSCVDASPRFQQANSHPNVYNKLEITKYMDKDVDWVVYFDADMVVLGELSALVTRIPERYQLMGVKDFPNVFRRWHLPEAS
jgi:lipopolysaccharide biosynthesis glycosyltransferase